jgi:hypothetical protein
LTTAINTWYWLLVAQPPQKEAKALPKDKPMIDQKSTNGWTRIGGIRSNSNPALKYVLALRNPSEKHPNGYIGCDCPSMKFRKGVKPHGDQEATCKHVRALMDGTVAMSDFDPTPFGTEWFQKRLAAKFEEAKKAL